MDIEELKQARNEAETEITTAINTILEKFAAKTGLYISDVYILDVSEVQEINGRKMKTIGRVSCEVNW